MSMRPSGDQIPDYWLTTNEFTDWQDEILRTAAFQNYQVSASAKGDIGSIYFSAGYMDQQGIIIETYYNRINFRLNSTINVSKNITAGINMSFSQGKRDGADSNKGANGGGKESSIHHALMVTPLMKLTEGTIEWGFPSNAGTTYPNPVEQLKYTTDRTKNSRVATSLWGQYQIIDGLNFRTQFSYNYDGQVYEYFQPENVVYNGSSSVGYSNSSTTNDLIWQNTLTYDKSFGLHNINLMAGQSLEERKYYRINAQATGFPYESIETLNVATTPTQASTTRTTYTNASVFGRASYNYAEKYLLTASIRYDGSSRFGSNNRWGLFPSVSAGWKINEENFMKDIDWINLLKIRASWGKAGNDRIGDYAYMALLSVVNTSWGDAVSSGIAPRNIANDDLQWESTETVDLGLDLSMLQNRIQLNVDWYLNTTKDLLFSVPIPYTTGFSSMTKNIGSIQNKGWEIDLTSHNLVGEFTWTTNLNLSRNKNEVLNMGDVKSFTTGLWDTRFLTEVGKPISQFYSYKTDGLLTDADFDANGDALVPTLASQEPGNVRYVDVNGDGSINSSDWVVHGNYQPKLSWGMTNRFSWKNFDLSILMQGQFGGKVLFMGQRQYDNGSGGVNNFARWLRCYKPDYEAIYGEGEDPIPWDYINKHNIDFSFDGKTPNPFGNNANDDDRRVYSSNYMRIKNITFGYTFPKKLLSKTIISSARVYISLDNVKKFDNYPAYSPETNSFGNNTTAQGVDYSTYPLSKRAIFGINITF
jgi:TonB-linked SusC/RagA family outer membrane protein